MIHNIPRPDISPAFTVKDIHRIREWEHERLKDATPEEYHADTTLRTEEALIRLGLADTATLDYVPIEKEAV